MKGKKLDLDNNVIKKPLKFSKEFIAEQKAYADKLAAALSANLNKTVLEEDAKDKAEELAKAKKLKSK